MILSQAGEREREYGWLEAAELYKKALSLMVETDFSRIGQAQEKVGYASLRAAMQAESVDLFRDKMHQAVANYKKAKEFYGRLGESERTPHRLCCDEKTIAYISYWLASEAVEKKRHVDECWRLTKEALRTFNKAGNALEYGKTYNQLSSSVFFISYLEWNSEIVRRVVKEAIDCGERAITLLSAINDPYDLARAYVSMACLFEWFGFWFLDLDQREKFCQKFLGYWQKALKFSEEAALLELTSMGGGSGSWSIDERLTIYEKALNCARKTKDKFLVGNALDMLTIDYFSKAFATDDNEERMKIFQRFLHYAEDAKQQFSSISSVSMGEASLMFGAEYHWTLALWEADLKERRNLLEKAVVDGLQG